MPIEPDDPTQIGLPIEATASQPVAADADTQSSYAWALDEDSTDDIGGTPRRRFGLSPKTITVAASVASLVTVVAVAVFGGYKWASRSQPPATPASAAATLDGVYRIDRPGKNERNGTPLIEPAQTTYWAFRSSCGDHGCSATYVRLDDTNHSVIYEPRRGGSFWLVGQAWQEVPRSVQVDQPDCAQPGGGFGLGQDTESIAWTMTPQPGGSLRGVWTSTVLTGECGLQGVVIEAPFEASRISDLPGGVDIPDPADIPPMPSPDLLTMTRPLDGLYRFTYEYSQETVNGHPATNPVPDAVQYWAFRSGCTKNGCAATAGQVFEENTQQNTGAVAVLWWRDGRWSSDPARQPAQQCSSAGSEVMSVEWSLMNAPGDALRGTGSGTFIDSECGHKGNVYKMPLALVRVGDVPESVVLADPILYVS